MSEINTYGSSVNGNGIIAIDHVPDHHVDHFTEADLELLSAPEDPPGLFSLGNIWGMARRKRVLVMGLAFGVALLMGMKSYQQKDNYAGTFQILVEPITDKNKVADLTGEVEPPSTEEYDYGTQFEVLLSPEVLEPIVQKISVKYPEVTLAELSQKLNVYRLGETKTIEIQYSNENPLQVTYVLEKVAEGYMNYSLSEQKKELSRGIEFINAQKPELQSRVNKLQSKIQKLRQEHNFIDPLKHAEKLDTNRDEISQQRQAIQQQIEKIRFKYDTLLDQKQQNVILNESKEYAEFKNQFNALERQIAVELARFGENSPTIKLLRQQQANLEPLLQKEALRTLNNQVTNTFNELQTLITEERNLSQAERRLTALFQQTPTLTRYYDQLQMELSIANESLGEFTSAGLQLQLQATKSESPWELIRPVSSPVAQPKGSFAKGLINGFVMGILLSLVIAFIYERFQGAFFTISDLKQRSRLPILGTIPFQRKLKTAEFNSQVVDWRPLLKSSSNGHDPLLNGTLESKDVIELDTSGDWDDLDDVEILGAPVPQGTSAEFLEAFRTLNTYINRVRFYDGRWSLAVTSAARGDGRTTVAIHLAQAAAAMGSKVLLVDAHLQGNQRDASHFLGVEGRPGLGDYLMGHNSLKEVIRRLNWEPNLYFINAGTFSPDATRLLASEKMGEFMDSVNQSFDAVIYITPAILGLADLAILSKKTNGTLFVVKFGKRGGIPNLSEAVERLKTAKIPVVGLVANHVKDYSIKSFLRN
jgi:polysaccharide biosynthesis transport protein